MRVKVRYSGTKLKEASKRTRQRIKKQLPKTMKKVGIAELTNVRQAYEAKSRGGTGSDGIKWAALDPKTIAKKNATVKRSKKPAKGRPKASGKKPAIAANASQIGVDSGLQRASAAPGFTGSDGKGGNVFEVKDAAVTIGFGREYSEYFDEKRQLMPGKLPAEWEQDADDIIVGDMEPILQEELDRDDT